VGDRLSAHLSAPPALSVSILAADLLHLSRELERIERAQASLVHVDIMDGHVTPTISVGPRFSSALTTPLLLDVHVLVAQPERILKDLQGGGADIVTVQLETTKRPLDTIARIEQIPARRGSTQHAYRGIAFGPGTAPDALQPLLTHLDLVVVLGVEFATLRPVGIDLLVDRVRRIRDLTRGSDVLVAVDGGVALDNLARIAESQPDIIVAGSALFADSFEQQVSAYWENVRPPA
jgi:ribulose-phosphate 3-epimerase